MKFGNDVIRNDRQGETKGSKVAVAAGMQHSARNACIGAARHSSKQLH